MHHHCFTASSLPTSGWLPHRHTIFTTIIRSHHMVSSQKTVGSSTCLEFLNITLDSIFFQASLLTEKLHCISLYISNYLLAHRCTKHQLLSLLNHLNYAIRIIPQGCSFLSHLWSQIATVPSLHGYIVLDDTCKTELRRWHHSFSSWNGISFSMMTSSCTPTQRPTTAEGGYPLVGHLDCRHSLFCPLFTSWTASTSQPFFRGMSGTKKSSLFTQTIPQFVKYQLLGGPGHMFHMFYNDFTSLSGSNI